MKQPSKIAKITCLNDLTNKAYGDPEYIKLAIKAANNMGANVVTLEAAIRWLNENAQETTEEDVVKEINICR